MLIHEQTGCNNKAYHTNTDTVQLPTKELLKKIGRQVKSI